MSAMQLRRYLDDQDIPVALFAQRIGVSVQALYRYLHGYRLPQRKVMDRIIRATHGKVTPNDFFDSAEAA
jgi:transcriptional regulator with XRE-family HTH domain